MIELSYRMLNDLSRIYGDSFYVLDEKLFEENYRNMIAAFRKYYSNTHIAYSYKTNYTPCLCKIINDNGGYAEIVSEMELWLAQKIGVAPCNIYYNGPYKKEEDIEKLMLLGGHINCDSQYEVSIIRKIAERNKQREFTVGIRCNLFIEGNDTSRFGFDVESQDLYTTIKRINDIPNLKVAGLHSHLPYRTIDSFRQRMSCLKDVLSGLSGYKWEYISVGGGYMGNVDAKLAKEFTFTPPTYEEYAQIVAGEMRNLFNKESNAPKLIIEPGSALVANTVKYVTRVLNIKRVRGKNIASMTGSTFCINPSVKGINRPIQVYTNVSEEGVIYKEIDLAGYTCIESDFLYKGYCGKLSVGDFVVFENVGSYSIVMKPPFILPEVSILGIDDYGNIKVVRKAQSMEEIYERFVY